MKNIIIMADDDDKGMDGNVSLEEAICRMETVSPGVRELFEHFQALIADDPGERFTYEFTALDLSAVHGLICLAAEHSEVMKMSQGIHDIVRRFRDFCIDCWVDLGLPREQAEMLDKAKNDA